MSQICQNGWKLRPLVRHKTSWRYNCKSLSHWTIRFCKEVTLTNNMMIEWGHNVIQWVMKKLWYMDVCLKMVHIFSHLPQLFDGQMVTNQLILGIRYVATNMTIPCWYILVLDGLVWFGNSFVNANIPGDPRRSRNIFTRTGFSGAMATGTSYSIIWPWKITIFNR